ncbi:hypothetical protein COU75_02725 [Candidatus Peregrinibacteria bacterium CG10_big_fil_rev_8_21_14_0_10_42_8]|nr:MAG: hypothetical protein COU75_02725 [Candidatus Peregrinibacteria bacterium CG10_big_fil_rev_8_21_14_0_10_42_8]
MKTLLKVFASALLLVVTVPAFAASLLDVANSRNRTAIEYLNEKGVIGGYPDGAFRPLNTVNRAELLKILVGGKGVSPTLEDYNNCFPDVTSEWFAPFVCYAKEQGWVDGYPDGTFRPANTVNTVESIKMVVNSQGYQVSGAEQTYLYDDVDNNAWYAPYVKVAKDKGILEQSNGSLGATSDMKRGGISEVIYRSMYIREKSLNRFTTLQTSSSKKSSESSSSSISSTASVPDPNAEKMAKIVKQYDAWFYDISKLTESYRPPYSTLMLLTLKTYSVALEAMEILSVRAKTQTLLFKEVELFVESQEIIDGSLDTFQSLQEQAAIDGQNQEYERQQHELDDQILQIQIDEQNRINQQNHTEYCQQLRRQMAANGSLDSGVGQQYLKDRGC